jgi:hypothetical protein
MARTPTRDRVFAALLRLFPSEFRGDFGDELRADFEDQEAATRRRVVGRWPVSGCGRSGTSCAADHASTWTCSSGMPATDSGCSAARIDRGRAPRRNRARRERRGAAAGAEAAVCFRFQAPASGFRLCNDDSSHAHAHRRGWSRATREGTDEHAAARPRADSGS